MSTTAQKTSGPHRQTNGAMQIYSHGTITDRGSLQTLTTTRRPPPRVKRSGITTFSRASAARLRQLLACAKGPDGWTCFGVTLTVPGPEIDGIQWRRLWRAYVQRLRRIGVILMIWRIEKQARGQPHIHGICWGAQARRCVDERWVTSLQTLIGEHWMENLGLLGPCSGPTKVLQYVEIISSDNEVAQYGNGLASVTHRKLWPGAEKHAVKFDGLDGKDKMGWWRYLAAHTSKSKQSQLGWKGRQWGVINRGHLDREEPILVELTQQAMHKVIRCLRKLTGCRYASGHGKQTWFDNPTTSLRLSEWATGICQPVRLAESMFFSPFKVWKKVKRERAKDRRRELLGVTV